MSSSGTATRKRVADCAVDITSGAVTAYVRQFTGRIAISSESRKKTPASAHDLTIAYSLAIERRRPAIFSVFAFAKTGNWKVVLHRVSARHLRLHRGVPFRCRKF